MFNLGDCYNNGRGVTKDFNQAREWYTKAAAQGHADASWLSTQCFQQLKNE
jgi:hypothetical protein